MADNLWGYAKNAAPGLFDLVGGAVASRAGQNEAANRLRTAQGPVYDASMAGAGTALGQAGSMDPNAFAQQRYDAQKGLLAGGDAASQDQLMRMLQSRGMLGASSFSASGVDPTTGNTQSWGTNAGAVNPMMAAFLAAKNQRDATMAAGSMDAGQKQIDTLVNRAGALQKNAGATQATGITAQGTQPSQSAALLKMIGGAGDIMKKTGMFGDGMDWLRKQFGGGYQTPWLNTNASDWGSDFYG